jgi:hypothetical protein
LRRSTEVEIGATCNDSLSTASKRGETRALTTRHVHSRQRRREIVRMSLIPPPHNQGYVSYLAATQLELTTAPWDEPHQLPALELLKSLDDLDEEEDEDDEDDDIDDLEDEEEDEDDLDEDYEDDEDEDEDEDDEDEDDDEDGGVKPLKMA